MKGSSTKENGLSRLGCGGLKRPSCGEEGDDALQRILENIGI